MKRPLSILFGLMLWVAACAPAPPHVQAYKALDAIAIGVDTAMSVSGDLYRAGKITEAQKCQLIQYHKAYQGAMVAAGLAVQSWGQLVRQGATTAQVAEAETEYRNAKVQVDQKWADLSAALRAQGVK